MSQIKQFITADFAENYVCFAQNEIQGDHWANDSVTIHPTIVRYQCQECPDSIVDELVDLTSQDLNHDAHAVQKIIS